MRPIALALCALLAAPPRAAAATGEIADAYRGAYASFLGGRLDDSSKNYRYVETLGVGGAAPTVNLALLARDAGRPEEALALWTKASLVAPQDAFIWNQRGWCYLSMGRAKEARGSFRKGIEAAKASYEAAEAQFGLGMTEFLDSSYRAAMDAWTGALLPSPYLIPATSAMMAEAAARLKRWGQSEVYLKQSLSGDNVQPDVYQRLSWTYGKTEDPREGWLAAKAVLDVLPGDEAAAKAMKDAARFIPEKPERLLPVRRQARPLLQKFREPPPGDKALTLRVGMYSNLDAEPAAVRRFYFVSGSDFKILHPELGEVNRGAANEQWEVIASQETGIIELRDVHNRLQYATKQSFRIQPVAAGASVLIKNPEIADLRARDVGDREVRGAVDAFPTVYGLQLVNEVGVEQFLFSRVAALAPEGAPLESMKALAVVWRTKAEWMRRSARGGLPLKLNTCDSRKCGAYAGVPDERDDATRAVLMTNGAKWERGGELYLGGEHYYCAGQTESGASDLTSSRPPASVYELEQRAHSFPEKDLMDELTPHARPAWARWTRVLDAAELRRRWPDGDDLGRVFHVAVSRRGRAGRVEELTVTGARGAARIEGFEKIEAFLSPGGLRSNLFTLQPLYDGKSLSRLIVWGMGTGDGRGLCVAGAFGRGAAGKDFQAILSHYLPGGRVADWRPIKVAMPPPVAKSGKGAARAAGDASEPAPEGVPAEEKDPDTALAGEPRPDAKLPFDPVKRRQIRERNKEKARQSVIEPANAP